MRRFLRLHVPVIAFFFAVALLITFPAVLQATTHFIGGDTSDSTEVARHMWWFTHSLSTGQDFFYQSNLGYPDGFSSKVFLSVPLYVLPMGLFAFVMPLALAFNLHIWLTMALNGWAMFLLARDRLQSTSIYPALLAGLIFMAAPVFQGHIADGHSGLIVMWPFPLYLLALFKLVEAPRLDWRWLALAVLFFFLAPMGHILQSIYVLLPLSGLFWLARVYLRDWRGAGSVLLVGIIGLGIYGLYLLPVVEETLAESAYSDTGGYVQYSLDALGIVTPSFFNPVFDLLLSYPRRVLGTNLTEGSAYVGLIVALLAIVGIWHGKGRARWWLLVAAVSWMLALGPVLKLFDQPVTLNAGDGYQTYITLPWAFLQNLPGFSIARTPGRFAFGLALALAILAGYGAKALFEWARLQGAATTDDTGGDISGARRTPRLTMVFVALAAVILFEYQFFWPMPTRSAEIPQAVVDLHQRDDVRAVFNVPYQHLLAAKDALLLQTAHQLPLIAGQVSRTTPVNPAKLAILQETLNPALLREVGTDVVIFHKERAAEIDQYDVLANRLSTQLGTPIYEDEQIAIFNVPDDGTLPQYVVSDAVPRPVTIENTLNTYLYVSEPGWLTLKQDMTSEGLILRELLDGISIHTYDAPEQTAYTTYVPLLMPGFHTLTYVLEPACPARYDDALQCRSITLAEADITWTPAPPSDPIAFEANITLASSQQQEDGAFTLWWQFDAPIDDHMVRFVHVVDETGTPIWQNDAPLGTFQAGETWVEAVPLPTADEIEPGTYAIRAGWYRLDDAGILTNLVVLNGPNEREASAEIGTLTLPGS